MSSENPQIQKPQNDADIERIINNITFERLKKLSYIAKIKWIFIFKTLRKLMSHQTMPPLKDTSWTGWLLQSGRGAGVFPH